jgi:hypothetical protein
LKLEQQHGQVDWGQQGDIRPGSPEAWSSEKDRERERELEIAYLNSHRILDKTGEILQI